MQTPASVKNKHIIILKNEQDERITKERELKNLSTNTPCLVPELEYSQYYRNKTCGEIPKNVEMTNEQKSNAGDKQIQDRKASMVKQNSFQLVSNFSKSIS